MSTLAKVLLVVVLGFLLINVVIGAVKWIAGVLIGLIVPVLLVLFVGFLFYALLNRKSVSGDRRLFP